MTFTLHLEFQICTKIISLAEVYPSIMCGWFVLNVWNGFWEEAVCISDYIMFCGCGHLGFNISIIITSGICSPLHHLYSVVLCVNPFQRRSCSCISNRNMWWQSWNSPKTVSIDQKKTSKLAENHLRNILTTFVYHKWIFYVVFKKSIPSAPYSCHHSFVLVNRYWISVS